VIPSAAVAVLAKESGVPSYVAAPVSTFDLTLDSGDEIPIEQRSRDEVTNLFGVPIAPEDIDVQNPAFDVTPSRLVTGIITERGICDASREGLYGLYPERRSAA